MGVRTAHSAAGIQHDTACDWYGKRIATCSSDRTVKVFDVEGEVG